MFGIDPAHTEVIDSPDAPEATAGDGSIEAMENLLEQGEVLQQGSESEPEAADDGDEVSDEQVEEVVEAAPEAVETAPAPVAAAPADSEWLKSIAETSKRQQELLERLTAKPEPEAEPVEAGPPDYLAAFDNDPEVRANVMRSLGLAVDSDNPYDHVFARQAVITFAAEQAQKRDADAVRNEVKALREELAAERAAAMKAAQTALVKETLDKTWNDYGKVEADVRAILDTTVLKAVAQGMAPAAAIDAVFKSPLAKLLPRKEAAAAGAPKKQVSPEQERLERAVAVSGRSGNRASPKKHATLGASLAAFERGFSR